MNTKYLITGADGLLARAFIRRLSERGADYLALDKPDFDITDSGRVGEICHSYRPDVIINCAAYNFVNRAEEEADAAFSVNASGPGLLARAAAKHKALLVHFSTNHVFDGSKESGLYIEKDTPNPVNRYGESKLGGENLIREETVNFLIFRISWLFGEGKNHFIHKLLQWSQNNEYVRVTCDEFAAPTYAYTVADIVLKTVEQGLVGLYHLPNTGYCSRYEWARLTLKTLGIRKFIRPVPMDFFKLPARRPRFAAMSNENISRELGVEIPSWEEGVRTFLREFPNGCE
jgi:dTDP-4-dehydrorhamnose reductase